MKHLLRMCCALLAIQAAPCLADAGYYVELGTDTAAENADSAWKTLVAKNKILLSHLHYYPKSVIQSGAVISTRIQAGPISTKTKAQKICSKLFSQNVPCFVIEGIGDAPPAEVLNLSEQSAHPLPWLATRDPIAPPPPVHESQPLPWLQDLSNKKGQVQVAEAIRVPLTDDFDPKGTGKVTVKSLPEVNPTFKNPPADKRDETSGNPSDWLTVDAFPNADIAMSFWEEARASLPKNARNLHVRVMKPLMAQQQSTASLSVGPFADSAHASAFCESIQAKDRGLHCHYDSNSPKVGETQVAHDNTHKNRRIMETRKLFQAEEPAAGPSKQYWVQVLSAPSQLEALQQWKTLEESNADLLRGMRSSVSASATDHSVFVVRVGPITGHDDAIKFCTKLQDRSVDCQVLLYSIKS